MSRTKYTAELKIRIAESYLAGEGSYGEIEGAIWSKREIHTDMGTKIP